MRIEKVDTTIGPWSEPGYESEYEALHRYHVRSDDGVVVFVYSRLAPHSPEDEARGNYGPLTQEEVLERARPLFGPRLSDIGTDLPPFGHRTLGEGAFTESSTLPDTYCHYHDLTLGSVENLVDYFAANANRPPPLVTIETPPGGAAVVVQDTLTVNHDALLSADGKGAGGGMDGGFPGQPEEGEPHHGKVQEILGVLRRIGFRQDALSLLGQPVGGGGGADTGGTPGHGFTYCGRGGTAPATDASGVHRGKPGGGVLVVVTRHLICRGGFSARGIDTLNTERGGASGGGLILIVYETKSDDPITASARGGRASGPGGNGLDGHVYAAPLPRSIMVMGD